jgi:hypothetical protein
LITFPVDVPCCVELQAAIRAANAKMVNAIVGFFIVSSIYGPKVFSEPQSLTLIQTVIEPT